METKKLIVNEYDGTSLEIETEDGECVASLDGAFRNYEEASEYAYDLVEAYNNTVGKGINPKYVSDLLEACKLILYRLRGQMVDGKYPDNIPAEIMTCEIVLESAIKKATE